MKEKKRKEKQKRDRVSWNVSSSWRLPPLLLLLFLHLCCCCTEVIRLVADCKAAPTLRRPDTPTKQFLPKSGFSVNMKKKKKKVNPTAMQQSTAIVFTDEFMCTPTHPRTHTRTGEIEKGKWWQWHNSIFFFFFFYCSGSLSPSLLRLTSSQVLLTLPPQLCAGARVYECLPACLPACLQTVHVRIWAVSASQSAHVYLFWPPLATPVAVGCAAFLLPFFFCCCWDVRLCAILLGLAIFYTMPSHCCLLLYIYIRWV